MSESKHTPEPWEFGYGQTREFGMCLGIGLNSAPDWHVVAVVSPADSVNHADEANARRIVACVNACAGVDTDLLEDGELDKPTMLVMQENKDLKHRCDELLAALDEISKLPSYRQDECSEMARDAIAKANGV